MIMNTTLTAVEENTELEAAAPEVTEAEMRSARIKMSVQLSVDGWFDNRRRLAGF
jgi:hypothetical protein